MRVVPRLVHIYVHVGEGGTELIIYVYKRALAGTKESPRLHTAFLMTYCMVGNFREVQIFVDFVCSYP